MDDLHELLAGADALEHLGAERLLLHLLAKILRDLIIDVRGQQRQPHLAHRVGDVRLADLAIAAHRLEDALEFFLEKIETQEPTIRASILASVILSLSNE